MTDAETTGGLPVHFWLFAFIAVLWNGYGAYDFVMTFAKGDAYMRGMGASDAYIAYFHAMPGWAIAAWAVGVWGAVAGTILLLLRSGLALYPFAASLAGVVVTFAYAYLLSNGGALMGKGGAWINSGVFIGCLVFIWYARAATRQGVLR